MGSDPIFFCDWGGEDLEMTSPVASFATVA